MDAPSDRFLGALRSRRFDSILVVVWAVFTFNSFVFDPYTIFGVDLEKCTDPIGRLLYWYGSKFDPMFLNPSIWFRTSMAIGAFVFGPFYLVGIYAIVHKKEWIQNWALLYAAGGVYEVVQYFVAEFVTAGPGTNFTVMFALNVPWLIIPILTAMRF